jgi:hypothetical protein
MNPSQLGASSFNSYRPHAKQLAQESLAVLQQLPLGFTPFLLKEIIEADVKFPIELRELENQLAYLKAMSAEQRTQELKPFAGLTLNTALESYDWVDLPGQFLEQLSAHLWATRQMDGFRAASESYVRKFHASVTPVPLAAARAGVVVIGQGVKDAASDRLFLKLRREGTLYTQVKPNDGLAILHAALEERARKLPAAYAHWYLDGGIAPSLAGFSTVGYGQLASVRDALASKMLAGFQAQHFDPEMLRTTLARTTYESLGIKASGDWPLEHFALTLLTEGSGTQIYSTTFVQWAAREAWRRAQPITLFARYAPRQRDRLMDEMLRGAQSSQAPETDPAGSLIDADMGAYYTWLNQQRLPGAEQARFLVWCENQPQAVVVSPAHKRGSVDSAPIDMAVLAQKVLS